MLEQPRELPKLPEGDAVRTLTPTGSRLSPLPKKTALALLAAVLAGIPLSPGGSSASRLAFVVAMIVAAVALTRLAVWAEQRLYRGLAGARPATRLWLSVFVPVAGLALLPLGLVVSAFAAVVDDGVLLAATFFAGLWFVSAACGTLVVALLDVVVSALTPDFRARIQAAVLGLLAVFFAFGAGVYVVGRRAAATIVTAAREGNLPEGLTLDLHDEKLQGAAAAAWLGRDGVEDLLVGAFLGVAAVFGLPALLSACGKLADAVMERLNPLAEAMDRAPASSTCASRWAAAATCARSPAASTAWWTR
jgi:hypothetical protein